MGQRESGARRIREETGDGEELVEYMLRVFRDEGESTKTRGRPPLGLPIGALGARADDARRGG
jgi:hypothetical protein